MAFINPFYRVKNIENFGFLKVNIRNFLQLEGRPQEFYTAIEELQLIREALIVAKEGGLVDSLQPGFNFYQMAISWLKLGNPIDQGVAVSAISNYEDINDPIASSFHQFVNWFKQNYLANIPIYQNIQIELGKSKLDSLKSLELKANDLEEEFRESLRQAQISLSESTDATNRQFTDNFSQQFNTQLEILRATGRDVIGEIKQAQSLTIWHEAYEKNIELYEHKLYGIKWTPLNWKGRFFYNFVPRFKNGMRVELDANFSSENRWHFDRKTSWIEIKFILYFIKRSIIFVWELVSQSIRYLLNKLFISARGQRTAWFSVLGVILISQSLIFLTLLIKGNLKDMPFNSLLSLATLSNITSNEFVFAKISIFLGLILVPSLGYAFANRNYRIYSNLLEQYRHRATVAQTLQGVLRYVEESDANKDIRLSLTTVAAVAMFEMKNVGHLTKRDGDTLPAGEILEGILRR